MIARAAGAMHRIRSLGLWRAAMAAPMAAVLLAAPAAANDDPDPATSATQAYAIPAQPLNTALARYAETSGVDVLVDESDVRGRRAAAVIGIFGPPQALRTMLDGTGLIARFTSRRSAIITRIDLPASNEAPSGASTEREGKGDVLVLDRMEVTASRLIGLSRPVVSNRFLNDVASQIRKIMSAAGIVDRGVDARIRIQTRIRADGTLHDVRVVIPSSNARRDARIVALLDGARLDVAPPEGMRQPLKFDVSGQ